MASKVNTRFVIILVVGVIALLGLLFLAYSIAYKSPSELAKAGDSMMASGDYKQAERLYSKAVNKDLSNTENMEKWVDSLEHILPETETEYQTLFKTDYIGAIKMIATVKRNDIAAHERYLSLRYNMLVSAYSRGMADLVIDETTGTLAFFNEAPDKVSEWERLRRYRGLAINMIAQVPNSALENEQTLLAQEDLERALLADPDDTESAIALMTITKFNLLRDIAEHDKEAQIEAVKQALDIGKAYLQTHPDDLLMQIEMLLQDAQLASRRIQAELEGKERVEAQYASLAGFVDRVDSIAEKLLGLDVGELTLDQIKRFYGLEKLIKPKDNLSQTRQMIDTLISSNKDNAELLLVAGRIAEEAGDREEALGWYSRIADIQTKPLSYEGLRLYRFKKSALRMTAMIRVDQALDLVGKPDTDTGDLETALELAKSSREAYAKSVSEDDQSLMLIDGKIALAKGDNQQALGLFKKFNELTLRENVIGLWAEAQAALRLNQLGVARDALLEMIPRESTNRKFLAMLTLAKIDEQLDEYESAAQLYKDILAFRPEYTPAVQGLDHVEKMINPELNDDPVLAAIFKARQIRKGTAQTPGDLGAAIQYLKDHIEELNYDPNIARELASILFDRGEINETIAVLSKSLELNPDHEYSEMFKKTLSALDPNDLVGSRIAMVRQAEGDELSKQLAIARIAYENNRPELLNETITKLVSMAPNDPGVIEIQFITAIRDGDVEKAKKLIAEQSLNPLMNLSYSARIAVAEGNTDKAIQLLEQAAASGTADASVYQMLATLKRQAGDLPAAIEAYEQSLAITPDNPTVIGDYVLALTQAGQYEEALSTARRLQQYGMSNTTFLNLWLNLEAVYGGESGQQIAIEQRKRL
ncbi:MAG: tetratricopeptide repeat protein, partial [Phycisphaerales bacterium]